jgi:hypothetical protein
MIQCEDCVYWYRGYNGAKTGYCHRYPPMFNPVFNYLQSKQNVVKQPDRSEAEWASTESIHNPDAWVFPITMEDDECGEGRKAKLS